VKRFEEQSVSLSNATKNLVEVNRQIQASVEERRPALEALTAGLKSRSEELEGLMKSFTRIIAETLKTAEERATAVSRMLTENTSTATKGVIDHFETMNRTAGTESRKAAEAVREANKSLIGDMSSAISDVSKRFSEATREMRQATQELQRDLSITREELRRGVLELPEEAREGAEAMRRVVGDQIKALTELSEIISRHGKNLDLSSPTLGEPRIRIESTAVNAEPVTSSFASEAALPARYASAPEPRRGTNGIGAAPSLAPVVKAPPRAVPRQAPTALRSAPSEDAGDGWVSDLLRRASTDEESVERLAETRPVENGATHLTIAAPAAPPAASSLSALSADIARAIDHDAAVELWARHHKGEKNLFTRRLYTLSGQQTFDDIRKKYQRDSDFRLAVDRYVGDFEKLLSEVTKSGKDRAAGTAYLTSDTGKVYTMLAHASGHFD
jgi:hypothetical protein